MICKDEIDIPIPKLKDQSNESIFEFKYKVFEILKDYNIYEKDQLRKLEKSIMKYNKYVSRKKLKMIMTEIQIFLRSGVDIPAYFSDFWAGLIKFRVAQRR